MVCKEVVLCASRYHQIDHILKSYSSKKRLTHFDFDDSGRKSVYKCVYKLDARLVKCLFLMYFNSKNGAAREN